MAVSWCFLHEEKRKGELERVKKNCAGKINTLKNMKIAAFLRLKYISKIYRTFW